jgi:hypothetical protein
MKARITYFFAALVALILVLASLPSHATERRDPFVLPDMPQTQAARSSSLMHATAAATKQVPTTSRKQKKASAPVEKSGQKAKSVQSGSSENAGSEQSGAGSGTGSE